MGIVIFGTKDFASLAHFYLKKQDNVIAFTMDSHWCKESHFEGLPVVPFEELKTKYPPYHNRLFLPINDNKVRAAKSAHAKSMGYDLVSYIHPSTTVSGEIGEHCFIMEHNIIQPYVKLGNNVIFWTANHIGHHSVIGSNVFLASHVVVCGHCTISDFAWLGANVTIRDGKMVGEGCTIGMHSAVIKDTDSWSTYMGVPAVKKL